MFNIYEKNCELSYSACVVVAERIWLFFEWHSKKKRRYSACVLAERIWLFFEWYSKKKRRYSACVLAERIWLFFEWYAAVRLGGGVCIRRKFGIQYRVQYVAVRTIRTFRTFGAAQRPIWAPPSARFWRRPASIWAASNVYAGRRRACTLVAVQRVRWSPPSVYAGRRKTITTL